MSDDAPPASPPDGTDPRILSSSGDEPEVTTACGYSTGKTYHTADCPVAERMNAPNHVPKSVAEWKGYTKCKRCKVKEGEDDYSRPGRSPDGSPARPHRISRARCLQIRVLLLMGAPRRQVADRLGLGRAVGRHGAGECSCSHDASSLTYDHDAHTYRVADDGGLPTQLTGRTPVSAEACADFRDTLARDGASAAPLARLFDVSEDAVRRHGAGDCTHQHDTPPVSYDASAQRWRVVADVRDPPARPSGVGDD